MLQQFVDQLKQKYPSIQDIRIPEENALSTVVASEQADSSATPDETKAELPSDSSEAVSASETEDSTESKKESEENTEEQRASEKKKMSVEASALAGQSFSPVIIIRRYQLKTVTALLSDIGAWADEHQCQIIPVILTPKETEQLQGFLFKDRELTPEQIVESYRSREGYPANARRHIVVALEEIQRLLRNVEQDYPTSGQHALGNGQYIQSLFTQLTHWGATIFHKPYSNALDIWSFLLEQFPGHRSLSRPENAHFPLRLEAFIQRHRMLAPLASQTFDNNDLEIENLSQPLLLMARSLRIEATRRLTSLSERKQRSRKRFLATTVSLGSIVLVALAAWWFLRPPVLASIKLPKGSTPGGIVGNYYGGQNFNRFLNKRADRQINMYWQSSPLQKVPADYFSVRWKGFLEAPHDGKYRICAEYDDGAQLRIDKKELINDWRVGGSRTKCKVLHLEKGWHSLYMQMFEARGGAIAKLSWERPKRPGIRPIPARHLCCTK